MSSNTLYSWIKLYKETVKITLKGLGHTRKNRQNTGNRMKQTLINITVMKIAEVKKEYILKEKWIKIQE